jgi:hypothetical protein
MSISSCAARAACCAAALLSACAAVNALSRDNYLRHRIAQVTYPMPASEVWPEVQGLMREQGLHAMETPGDHVLETEWKDVMAPSRIAGRFVKYVAVAVSVPDDPSRTQVAIYKLTKSAREERVVGDGVVVQGHKQAGPSLASTDPIIAATAERPANTDGMTPSQLQYMGEQREGQLRMVSDLRDGDRDEAMEFALLKRIAPEAAQQMEAEVAARFP